MDNRGDSDDDERMSDITERLHVSIPLTDAYVLRGPKFTLVINENPTTPEERILDDEGK